MGHRHVVRLSVGSAIAAVISAYLLLTTTYLWYGSYYIPASLFTGAGIFWGLVAAMCLDMIQMNPADSHTTTTLLTQYLASRLFLSLGILWWWPMNKYFKDCKKTQEQALKYILDQNKDTDYGRDHQFASIKTREQFVAQHPLTTFAHFDKYVERVAKGEKNVMTKADVIYLGLTSGTTGKNKMYPQTMENLMGFMKPFSFMRLQLHGLYKNVGLKRNFLFRLFHPQKRSVGGICMGVIGQIVPVEPSDCNITPMEFIEIYTESPSFYVQAIFALSESEIGRIDGLSSDLMYAFFNFMVHNHDKICKSLETGVIGEFPSLDENIRWKMSDHLKPDAVRAEKVRTELRGKREGLALRLWPDLAFCGCAKTGGFANSAQLLSKSYLKNVPMAFIAHAGTEGITGISMDVEDPDEYTLQTNVQFMEFIPIENAEEDQPKTLFMEQLQVGKQYEVVVTNMNGLCRNRFGDVIEVTGFRQSTPKYKISYRTGQILNVADDRTPEDAVYEAIIKAAEKWQGVTVIDYTATESSHLEKINGEVPSPGCYFIFMEIASEGQDDMRLTQMHADGLEEALCETHGSYKEFRRQGSVGPLKLIQVRAGCFSAVRAAIFGDMVSSQFKMPRVQRKAEILQVLWDHHL